MTTRTEGGRPLSRVKARSQEEEKRKPGCSEEHTVELEVEEEGDGESRHSLKDAALTVLCTRIQPPPRDALEGRVDEAAGAQEPDRGGLAILVVVVVFRRRGRRRTGVEEGEGGQRGIDDALVDVVVESAVDRYWELNPLSVVLHLLFLARGGPAAAARRLVF